MTHNEAVDFLMEEYSIYDTENKVLYFADTGGGPLLCYGIQIFYILTDDNSLWKESGLTEFCLGCIPAPGAGYRNEYGYSKHYSFDIVPFEASRPFVDEFVNYLEEKDVLKNCIVDPKSLTEEVDEEFRRRNPSLIPLLEEAERRLYYDRNRTC